MKLLLETVRLGNTRRVPSFWSGNSPSRGWFV